MYQSNRKLPVIFSILSSKLLFFTKRRNQLFFGFFSENVRKNSHRKIYRISNEKIRKIFRTPLMIPITRTQISPLRTITPFETFSFLNCFQPFFDPFFFYQATVLTFWWPKNVFLFRVFIMVQNGSKWHADHHKEAES